MLPLSAATNVAGVIGDPVEHSLSPAIHNAAYQALGLDWVYVGFRVPAGQADLAVAGAGALGVRGLSVTMPHKQQAAAVVDELSPTAARLAAVNTVVFEDGCSYGDSTDGSGFVTALREELSLAPEGRNCLVVGTGGAAKAVILALAEAGAAHVGVLGRSPTRAEAAASLAGVAGGVGTERDVVAADLVVHATPVGMAGVGSGSGLGLLGSAQFRAGQVVVDLVYDPPETDLMRAALAAGATVANGLGMLVYQAAAQFTLFTGLPAPVAAMRAAVRKAVPNEMQ